MTIIKILIAAFIIWFGYFVVVQKIDLSFLIGSPEQKFWKWFQTNSDLYYNSKFGDKKLLDELSYELDKIDNNFVYELSGVRKDGKREFVISADGVISSFPELINFVSVAPKFDKWEIIAFRQRSKNLETMYIEMGDDKLSCSDVFFDYAPNGDKIDIILYVKNLPEDKDGYSKFNKIIYLILDAVLGEYDTEMKVGGIQLKNLSDVSIDKLLPIIKMPQIFDDYFSNQKVND